jgi:hypothetical protein
MTRPTTPPDLEAAGYRIEFGDPTLESPPGFQELAGRYWWTWSAPGAGIDSSNGEWDTPDEAIADARRDTEQQRIIDAMTEPRT